MTGETGVGDKDFRGFDQSFAQVLEERGHDQDLRRRLEHAQPLADRRHAHAERGREIGLVQNLAMPAGQEREKTAEGGEVLHGRDRAHVALEIGLQIGCKPKSSRRRPRQGLGITAAPQRHPRRLARRERQEREHRGPTRHRLGHALHKRCFLRPGKEPLPGAPRLAIDARPDEGENLGHILHFIEDGGRLDRVEESLRIVAQPGNDIGVFKEKVVRFGKEMPQQPGLPRSAWPGQDEGWKIL